MRAVVIERGGQSVEIVADMQPGAGTKDLVGYVRLPRESRADDLVRLHVLYRSGRSAQVSTLEPEDFDGALPETLGGILSHDAAAAVARARFDRARPAAYYGVESWGRADSPRLSLVVPAGGNLDMIRVRAGIVARAGELVEVIYAVGADQAPAARAAIVQAHAVYRVPHRLALCAADVDPCTRLRVAVAVAAGETVLVTGADVLPEGHDWLEAACGVPTDGAGLRALAMADHHGAPIGALDAAAPSQAAEAMALRRSAADAFALADLNYPDPGVVLSHLGRALGIDRQAPAGRTPALVRYADCRANPAEVQIARAALRVLEAVPSGLPDDLPSGA